jgi:GNAT superfamily N-acetyltransferase
VLFPAGIAETAKRQLLEMGFTMLDPMPAMAVDIGNLVKTTLPVGYTFTRIFSGDQASSWTEVLTTGYPIPRALSRILSPEVLEAKPNPDARTQFYAVRHGERLVAISMLYLARGLAGVYCVATLPEERGKGLGAYVTAEALRAVSHAGYNVGVLQSSEAGHSIYRDLGFQDVGQVHMFVRVTEGS